MNICVAISAKLHVSLLEAEVVRPACTVGCHHFSYYVKKMKMRAQLSAERIS